MNKVLWEYWENLKHYYTNYLKKVWNHSRRVYKRFWRGLKEILKEIRSGVKKVCSRFMITYTWLNISKRLMDFKGI